MTSELVSGVLLDCDYIIALSRVTETTHEKAKALQNIIAPFPQMILRSTAYELATVVARKFDHSMAMILLKELKDSAVSWLSLESIEQAAWKEFFSHSKKSTSFFDCANLVAAKYYDLKIASFDSFYPKSVLLK